MQREVNIASATSGVSQFILNTADADSSGIELEGTYRLLDNFLLLANIGLIDASYQDVCADISGDGNADDREKQLDIPRVPETTYGFGLIWDTELDAIGLLTLRANFQHKDAFAYSDNNLGWVSEVDMLDASITWDTSVEGLSLSLYGKTYSTHQRSVPIRNLRSANLYQPVFGCPIQSPLNPERFRHLNADATSASN